MKRPVAKMRRSELEQEARRLGIENTDRYLARELRAVVAGRLRARQGTAG